MVKCVKPNLHEEMEPGLGDQSTISHRVDSLLMGRMQKILVVPTSLKSVCKSSHTQTQWSLVTFYLTHMVLVKKGVGGGGGIGRNCNQ